MELTCFAFWKPQRPRIPEWMAWISSVTVQEDDDRLSLWSLETEQFGQTFKFSWFSKNLTPIKHRLIHWVSVDDGNRGGGKRICFVLGQLVSGADNMLFFFILSLSLSLLALVS